MRTTPLRSMTGFGQSESEIPGGRLRVEIRTVNHRFLHVQIRTPPGLERHEAAVERALREHFVRGHVKVGVIMEVGTAGGSALTVPLDLERARGYVEALRTLQDRLGLEGSVDVATLARFRDIFHPSQADGFAIEVSEEVLVAVAGEAARQAVAMREQEGVRLASDLSARLDAMEAEVTAVEARAPRRLIAERDRLRAALRDLLGGEIAVDEERLAREVAHLAERLDVHEEIVRFRSHLAMFREALSAGDPAGVGKRFGFIAQELLREANTMGSKANDTEIAASVVVLKEELERLREQLENVE